jgi:class 3 adenylate cyclase
MAKKGPEGAEELAHYLNSYLAQIVKCLASYGGDVFKFAGDAMIVLWPPSNSEQALLVRKAAQAALEIQEKLFQAALADSVVLSVKIGIGVGKCSVVLIGGVLNRMEYLAAGDPLNQAFQAEHAAQAGDVILSAEAWKLAADALVPKRILDNGYAVIERCEQPLPRVNISKSVQISDSYSMKTIAAIKNYVPGAIIPYLNTSMEKYASELRKVSVLFVSVGVSEETMKNISLYQEMDSLLKIQDSVSRVQASVYKFEGSLNKFLFDDKGSTLLAVFGLPPLAHVDDSLRAILSAFDIITSLKSIGLSASIGVTSGIAFCGVAGSHTRKEYAVLGDVVNTSARLMQFAKKEGKSIVCDHQTSYSSRSKVHFEALEPISVKGKSERIKVFEPIVQGKVYNLKIRQDKFKASDSKSLDLSSESLDLVSRKSSTSSNERPSPIIGNTTPKPSGVFGMLLGKSSPKLEEQPNSRLSRKDSGGSSGSKGSSRFSNLKATASARASGLFGHIRSSSKVTLTRSQSLDIAELDEENEEKSSETKLADLGELAQREKIHWESKIKDRIKGLTISKLSNKQAWYTHAVVKLPPELLDGATVSFKAESNIGEMKKAVLDHVKFNHPNHSKNPINLKHQDYVLYSLETKFPLVLEHLSLDVIPVLISELPLSEERVIELELIRSLKTEVPVKDGRQEIRNELAEKLNNLLRPNSKNEVIIIEGELGYGKTRFLIDSICKSSTFVCCSTANSVSTGKFLEVFAEIFEQILDYSCEMEEVSEDHDVYHIWDDVSGSQEKRKSYLEKLFAHDSLGAYLPCLNLIWDYYNFSSTAEYDALSEQQKVDACKALLLLILKKFSKDNAFVMVIDDAAYLDSISWSFTLQLVEEVQNMLLVLGTPPMNMSYLRTFMRENCNEYNILLQLEDVKVFKMKQLPNQVIYNIALAELGVRTVRDKLAQLLISRSRGNPLVCKELIFELRLQGLINLTDNGKYKVCILSNDFSDSNCPVPISMLSMLGCKIDRLPITHQLLLKIASLVGNQFSLTVLNEVYPIPEEKALLEKYVFELCELNILSFVQESKRDPGSTVSKEDRVYEFVDGFMREVVQSRLLRKLRKPIEMAISKLYEDKKLILSPKKTNRKEMLTDILEVSKTNNTSNPSFQKHFKKRFVRLSGNELVIYDSPESNKVWRLINIVEGIKVLLISEDECGRNHCIRIESKNWSKHDTLITDRIVWFYIVFQNSSSAEEWKSQIMSRLEFAGPPAQSRIKSPDVDDVKYLLASGHGHRRTGSGNK